MFPKAGAEEKPDGFTIARGTHEDTGREVTCKGNFGPVSEGQMIRVLRWSEKSDPRFGPSISVWAIEHADPVSRAALLKYLEHMPGVGEATARRIIDELGEGCLEKIDRDPSILLGIPRIGEEQLRDITARWEELRADRKAMIHLSGLGLGDSTSQKIIGHFGTRTVEVIREDPYRMCEVPGVGFRIADQVASRSGIGPLDPRRLQAGVEFILEEAENDGHICLSREEIFARAVDVLARGESRPDEAATEAALQQMVDSGRLWIEEGPDGIERIYTTEHFMIETRLYSQLRSRITGTIPVAPEDLREKPEGSLLTDEQWEGVSRGMIEDLSVLTGGPGCGKTFTLSTLLDEADARGQSVCCLAPTGKAAKRMSETTGRSASTIHRRLGYKGLRAPSFLEEEVPASERIAADLVVVDEASMLDMRLAERLFSHIDPSSRIVLVGDPGQLPAVGAGSVLHDMIESGRVPKTELTEVFRQAESSLLVENAHRIRHGKEPFWSREEAEAELGRKFLDDWRFVEKAGSGSTLEESLRQARSVSSELGVDPEEVMVTAPSKKGGCGVHALNIALAGERNPTGTLIREGENPLRVGDRVMNTRNRYGANAVMNGDQGNVVRWDKTNRTAWVDFGLDELVPFAGEETASLIPAYAATTHKLQGSEYPAVICPVSPETNPRLLSRNMFYTGMTRAKQVCVMVGSREVLREAIGRDGSRRNTTLDLRVGQLAPRIKARAERMKEKKLTARSARDLLYR